MELGLSLGDASKSFSSGFMDRAHRQRPISANFCMGLSIGPIPIADDDGDEEDGFKSYENGTEEPSIQLDLLPSTRLSSGEGSSEAGLDVNRSPNSGTSSFQMELGRKRDSADEDDENGNNNARKKLRLSKEQSAFLEVTFKEHNTLNTVSTKQKLALAKKLNLRPRQVEVWFQNRRARTKLKQTEVECEYLKRCCDTLTEENRRLHKEVHQLRAMSTSNPFNLQPPATTLTMCPSCERVATNSNPKPHFMG